MQKCNKTINNRTRHPATNIRVQHDWSPKRTLYLHKNRKMIIQHVESEARSNMILLLRSTFLQWQNSYLLKNCMISGSWLKNLCWKDANSDNHWSLRVSHQCCQGEDRYMWVNCHESQAEKTESVTEHLTCKTAEAVAEANIVTERTTKPAHPMGRPVTPWQHSSLQGLWSLTARWPLWTRYHIHNSCLYMIWR